MPDVETNAGSIWQESLIPQQKEVPEPVSEAMKAQLQSHPPLSQVTVVSGDHFDLTVVLEIPSSRSHEPWQVAVWHSTDGGEWAESPLLPTEAEEAPPSLQGNTAGFPRAFFRTLVSFKSSFQFSLKFRHGEDEIWRWIRDEQGLGDGLIVAKTQAAVSEDLSVLITGLNKQWTVSNCMSQAPRSQLWSLEAPVPGIDMDQSSVRNLEIGTPWGSFLRWFALVRTWTPWLASRQGQSHFELDQDAILCSFLSPGGRHLVLLALSGINDVVSVLQDTGRGSISVHMRNDGTSEETSVILVAESDDFQNALAAVMYQARSLVMRKKQTGPLWNQDLEALADGIKPQWQESWYDGLGYCTWNALGQKLSEERIRQAVDKLVEQDIKFTSFIIDDNWQSLDYRGNGQFQYGWVDFEADPKAFPGGLKATVSYIRDKFPDVKHVAVWHALLGYWGGIAPAGKIAKTYKTVRVSREDEERFNLPFGSTMTVVAGEDVSKFYDDFYRFLSDAGINAVKTDAQSMLDTWTQASARRDMTQAYLDAWMVASLRHFGGNAISCMSQIPQTLFYSQMPTNRAPILVRNSDDFFPDVPSSHTWHVWTNAHNSLFTQYLNVLPDWDMFQTVHDYSGFHAAARCVSGGPIYITDAPGEHDMNLIRQMTGQTPRGSTVIFRPSCVGKTVDPYAGYHDDCLLKIGTYHGGSATGTPILAIFNISARPLTELIPLSCFSGTSPDTKYIVRAHTTGSISPPMNADHSTALLTASLDIRGYEIFTAFPLATFTGKKHSQIQVSNLGLVGKMTGSAAIVASHISKLENGRILLDTRLKALGVLGVYISTLPDMTVEGDFMATIQEQPVPVETVSVSTEDRHALFIDVETAWKKMNLNSGWSNEVEVKVYFDS